MKMNITKLIPLLALLSGFGGLAYADGINEPIPSFYQEPGIAPTRDYVNQHASEHIDLFTGKLQYHFVDLYIPGNGGLDLKVQRSYNSLNEDLTEFSPAGLGWTMHFGRVLRRATSSLCDKVNGPATNPVLELPDGARRVLYVALDGLSWITTDFWKAECNLTAPQGGLNVFSPDGTRYEMTVQGHSFGSPTNVQNSYYVSKITDRNGNSLSVNYVFLPNGVTAVASVTASDGRAAIFSYQGTQLATVKDGTVSGNGTPVAGGRTWTYSQTAASADSFFLTEVRRPDGESWRFAYNPTSTSSAGRYSMRRVTYPTGGTIDYTYAFVNFAQNPAIPTSTVISRKVASPGGIWTWAYTPATLPFIPDSNNGVRYSIPPSPGDEAKRMDQTTVTGPDESRTHYHVGYNSAFSGMAYLIGSRLGNSSHFQVEAFSYTLMTISNQQNKRPGNNLVADGATGAPLLNSHDIYRFDESFTSTYGNFDNFGNPRTITEHGSDTRTTNVTYNVNPAKWIIRQKKNETVTDGSETLAITRTFDANANLLSETRAGVPTRFTYTQQGDLASRTDARNTTTHYSSYFRGIPRTENQPEGINVTRTVSNAGNVTSQTDGEQSTISFSYDGLNRVTGISHPLGNPADVSWGAATRTVTRGPYRSVTTFDGFGREASVQHSDTASGESIVQNYRLDSLGRRVFASYPNATIGTRFDYDMLDRLTAVYNEYDPAIGSWTSSRTNGYFSYGIELVNENGDTYFHGSRSYGDPDKSELMLIWTPLDRSEPGTTITRNIAGQMTSVTQGVVTRRHDYDPHFFLTSITEPETGVTIMGRDAVGNLISRQVGTSGQTTYTYDDRNRLTAILYPSGTPGVTRTYFNDDKLKSVDNGIARRDYLYDANKNLTREALTIGARTFPVVYGYDANDAHATIQYGSAGTVTYSPDAFGRPRQAAPYVTSVAYHPSGQASSFTYANGVQTTIGLNGRQWPANLQIAKSSRLFDMNYEYDPVGNITSIGNAVDSSYDRTMGYDPLDRLTVISGPWGSGNIRYDLRGNITSQRFGTFGLSYVYDSQTHRLARVDGSKSYTMEYDLYGNVIGNGTTRFNYNDAANMQCAYCEKANETLYDYDGGNQRVWKRKGGVETFFVHGSGGQLLWEETPHATRKEYIYLGGKQVAIREQILP